MTLTELKTFLKLKKELFGNNKFIIVDKNPKWIIYNKLLPKYLKMIKSIY